MPEVCSSVLGSPAALPTGLTWERRGGQGNVPVSPSRLVPQEPPQPLQQLPKGRVPTGTPQDTALASLATPGWASARGAQGARPCSNPAWHCSTASTTLQHLVPTLVSPVPLWPGRRRGVAPGHGGTAPWWHRAMVTHGHHAVAFGRARPARNGPDVTLTPT